MRIIVDADACPKQIKEMLFRAAIRTRTHLMLISNHSITTPVSTYICKVQVEQGLDVADDRIVSLLTEGDLVITADIPLAAAVIGKNALALNPRGQLYTEANINERLAIRNLNTDLRNSGMLRGGSAQLSKRDIQAFANELDRLLAKRR